ncbi:calpain-9-like isoform X2 [Anticarsia gemmatalis]|uniref:calpain-9-like isoform X2 n=1 Tax=Anticarsia gemmatalis TaxID=129554 RepID=UPI003F76CADB
MRKFMRTRAHAPPAAAPHPAHPGHTGHPGHPGHPGPPAALPPLNGHAHKTNGHANGVGARRDDQHSTLSRYWSGSECSGVAASCAPGAGCAGGALFEDAQFPASWRALGDKRLAAAVRWLRPHELCARPRFRGDERAASPSSGAPAADDDDEPARWHVEAGALGGAAVCVAAAALAGTPRLLDRALPPQSFTHRYSGAFRFRFWVFGAWREVVVDDRLPARGGRLLGAASALRDDFTLALLHKAYAKLHGGYAALRGTGTARALQDLTGAIVQSFSLRHQPHALTFQVLNSAVPRSTLLVATLAQDGGKRPRHGLLAGQAYCVTGLARVRDAGGAAGAGGGALVRVRAVCGRGLWAGAWSPLSAEWRALPPADRDLLADRADEPGDFWMSFGEFAATFGSLELVHVGPDDWLREPALHARRPWRAVLARRRWRTGYNAGGPPACTETTGTNPQFHVQIPRAEAGGARKCHVVVSVTQQYDVRGARLRAIGFCVYELPAAGGTLRREPRPLRGLRALDVTHESRAREVVTFFTLPPGRYLVVPHTRRPHTDAAFLLRILTDDHTDVWELNEDNLVVRDLCAEFRDDERAVPAEIRAAASKLLPEGEAEEAQVDAAGLRAALRRVWRVCLCAAPSLELCRALVALRDAALSGAMRARDVPALLALLAYWRAAFLRLAARRCGPPRVSSYRLRALLWASGVTASNKVLECLVLRFARRAALSEEDYVMALARLHLAHERYRSLDAKMKANPLSLEEMILMTIYS